MSELTVCKAQGCNRPIPKGGSGYCARCVTDGRVPVPRPASAPWSNWRDRKEQAAFKARLMVVFGGRCAAVGGLSTFVDLPQGVRCPVTDTGLLDAHHGKDGLPDLLLCNNHHAVIDPYARRRR